MFGRLFFDWQVNQLIKVELTSNNLRIKNTFYKVNKLQSIKNFTDRSDLSCLDNNNHDNSSPLPLTFPSPASLH